MDSNYMGLQPLVGASIQWAVPSGLGKAGTTFHRATFASRRGALATKKKKGQLLFVGVMLFLQLHQVLVHGGFSIGG